MVSYWDVNIITYYNFITNLLELRGNQASCGLTSMLQAANCQTAVLSDASSCQGAIIKMICFFESRTSLMTLHKLIHMAQEK